jgi:hypothetical protein
MNSVAPIHTPCKNCVFSKYSGKTQDGCHLDFIDRYKNSGAEILEAYDNDLEFYIINNKKCLGYREESFFKRKGMESSSIEDKKNYFYGENHINYLAIINLQNFSIESLDALGPIFKECKVLPKKIIFIRHNTSPAVFTYTKIKEFFLNSGIDCEWRIQTMVTDQLGYGDILHNVLNMNKAYRFVLSVQKFSKNIPDLVSRAEAIVCEELGSFNILSEQNRDNIIFSAPSYRYSYVVNKENILNNEKLYTFI